MGYRDDEAGHQQVVAENSSSGVRAISPPWRSAAYAASVGIFVILCIAGLSLARPVLLPTVSAFVVVMMLSPLAAEAERRRIPPLLSALVLWLLVIAIFYGVIVMISAPAVEWIGKAPEIGRNIQEKLRVLEQPLSALIDLRNALLPAGGKPDVGIDIVSILKPAVSVVTPAIGELFIFFATLFFMLLGRERLRQMIVSYFEGREARLKMLRVIHDFEQNLATYLGTVIVINVVVGIAAGVIAWVVGLPQPTAWAVIGFVLNFVPYVGALIVELAMFLVGLVAFPTLTQAIMAPILFVALATVEGQFVTPSIVGRRITLNPLIVFLSLVFWTWLWGPVGAFLAAPLLIMALAATGQLFPKEGPLLPD